MSDSTRPQNQSRFNMLPLPNIDWVNFMSLQKYFENTGWFLQENVLPFYILDLVYHSMAALIISLEWGVDIDNTILQLLITLS